MKRHIPTLVACLIALPIAVVAWLYLWPHTERTSAALNFSSGQIKSGHRFQISVGDSWTVADQKIRRQFTPSYILWEKGGPPPANGQTDSQADRRDVDGPLLVGDASVVYRDSSWRNGMITLELHDGRVTQIMWNYDPLYVDL